MHKLALTLSALALFGCHTRLQNPVSWARAETEFPLGPYLVQKSNTEVVVGVEAPAGETPIVTWRIAGDTEWQTSEATSAKRLWTAVLNIEDPGTQVEYRVASETRQSGPHRFQFGRDPDEAFRFVAYGDTRTGHRVHRNVIEGINREQIDFIVHSGDMVEQGGLREEWNTFFAIEAPILKNHLFFGAVGNHDISSRALFERYFLNRAWTEEARYYVREWGSVRMVFVDPLDECREGCLQHYFLNQALEEGVKKDQWLVMVIHYPPYSSGKHGSYVQHRKALAPLAKKYGVELILSGHDHNYERTKVFDGTQYVVSSSAGAPIRPVKPKWFTEVARTEPHYLLVDVSETVMTGRAINLNGQTFDKFVIQKNPPRP